MAVGSEPGADLVDALLDTTGHERIDDVRDERDSHAAVSTAHTQLVFGRSRSACAATSVYWWIVSGSVPQELVQRGELFGRENDFRRDALNAGEIVVESHDRPCALVDRDLCVVPIPSVDVQLAC